MKIIDTRGELCPKPIIMTKKESTGMAQGEEFVILTDNDTSLNNLKRFLTDNGFSFSVNREKDYYQMKVIKEKNQIVESKVEDYCQINPLSRQVVCFKSDQMGIGDSQLGEILIKGFINALKEQNPLPEYLVFYNRGVLLTLDDHALNTGLKEMENKGVKIIVCGTCVDYYKVKEKISIGQISNMFSILEILQKSEKIIYP